MAKNAASLSGACVEVEAFPERAVVIVGTDLEHRAGRALREFCADRIA
jgi:hypothetical protein